MKLLRSMHFRTHRGIKTNRVLAVLVSVFVLVSLSGCFGGGAVRHESWPGLTLHNGTLYAANYESIDAVDAETGKEYWSFPAESDQDYGPFYATPVVAPDEGDHGMIFVAGFKDQIVYALTLGESAAERPDEVWQNSEANGQYVGSGTVADGKFIIGNGDGNVYALDITSGDPAWIFQTNDRVWATPVVEGDVVYVAGLDHTFYAVDLTSGDELWSLELDGAIAGTPVLDNGYAWVGDFSSKLYQIDLSEKAIAWTYTADDWVWGSPLLVDRTLYFTDVGGHVYALDVDSQELMWDKPVEINDIVHSRPAVNADGSLLFVSGYEKGGTYAITTSSGTKQASWGFEMDNPGQLPGDMVADEDRLYVMPILIETRIRAFDLATGELLWPVETE